MSASVATSRLLALSLASLALPSAAFAGTGTLSLNYSLSTCIEWDIQVDLTWSDGMPPDRSLSDSTLDSATYSGFSAVAAATLPDGTVDSAGSVTAEGTVFDYVDPSDTDVVRFVIQADDVEILAEFNLLGELGGVTLFDPDYSAASTTITTSTPGCVETGAPTSVVAVADRDGDGFEDDSDCDDTNGSVYPGASEDTTVVDGLDQDCDGVDGPTIAGFTLALVEDDEIVATSTDVPGLSVTYPPGTTFPAGTTMTQTANGGVTLLEIDGPVMPSGKTKSISYDTTPSYSEDAIYSAGYRRTFQATVEKFRACVYDSGSRVDIGSVHPRACAREGGLSLWWYGGFYRTGDSAGSVPTEYYALDVADVLGLGIHTFYREGSVDAFTLTAGSVTAAATREERNAVDAFGEAFTWYPVTELTITVGDLSYTSIALFDDTDGDGVPDADERLAYGTDPAAADSDGDGVSDGAEVAAGMDPTDATSTPGTDGDHDFLDLSTEAYLGTDPNDADTDGDGVSDGLELFDGTDPLDAASNTLQDADGDGQDDRDADADGDGILAWAEALLGTSDETADSDGDGVRDGDELADGTDPSDASSADLQDADSDGIDDRGDNCPDAANADQADSDGNGAGDACDTTGDTGTPDTGTNETGGTDDTGTPKTDEGCGCQTSATGGVAGAWLLALGILAVGRRRK